MKLKISEIEGDLLDERSQKKIHFDFSLEAMKSQMQEKLLDHKVKFEEQVMREKENNYKLKVEMQGLQERNQILKEQLMVFRERITELEKESILQSKENYTLNCELDYEANKARKYEAKNEQLLGAASSGYKTDEKERERLV